MFEKDLPGHNTTGFNEQVEIGRAPLRDVRHDQQLVGLQQERRQLQEHEADRAPAREVGGLRRQPPAERGAQAGRHHPARVREAAGRGGRVAEGEGRDDLRHPRRTAAPATVGRHHPEGESHLRPRARLEGRRARAAAPGQAREVGNALRDGEAREVHRGQGRVPPAPRPRALDPLDTIVVLELGK